MGPQPRSATRVSKAAVRWSNLLVFLALQDDTYTDSYISTIGVDFVSHPCCLRTFHVGRQITATDTAP
jgi:hypothetical protein